MNFRSILFEDSEKEIIEETVEAPNFFVDLNLDQVIGAITSSKQEYNLKPFYYAPLNERDAIGYRQEIMRDLENNDLFENIRIFAQKMRTMREHLKVANKADYRYSKEAWFLHAGDIYCGAISFLMQGFSLVTLKSRGFLAFSAYLSAYAKSDSFTSLLAETEKLKADLSTVKYSLLIRGLNVRVDKYNFEADYSEEVEKIFDKFKQGAVKDYAVAFSGWPGINHVGAQILELVARLYPDIFANLLNYSLKNADFPDKTITNFDREIQFYIAYLEHIAQLKRAGLKFCYPKITNTLKEVYNLEGFDLALAHKLVAQNGAVVCNDFYLRDSERILVVSGPNQGGKTTFARSFGQLHYLAALGCPVPGTGAQLFLADGLFTHFEKQEDVKKMRGKLQDDLIRIHEIFETATSNSIIIMNEILTSTTLKDAVLLSKRIMEKIVQLDSLCVWVTFIDELAAFNDKIVSMVSTTVPENPTLRTYKIIRRPADGLAYAISIAEKYRLTYDWLKERLRP